MYIPVSVRRDLLTVVIRESVVSQDASQAIAIIVHSLGKLNCKWTEMESNFFTVSSSCNHNNSSRISDGGDYTGSRNSSSAVVQ